MFHYWPQKSVKKNRWMVISKLVRSKIISSDSEVLDPNEFAMYDSVLKCHISSKPSLQ